MNTRQPFENTNTTGNIFDTLFQSFMNQQPVPATTSTQLPRARPSANQMRNNEINAATMNTIQETMIGYNNNIRAYNENIRIFLEIIEANQSNAQGIANADLSANVPSREQIPREPDANEMFNNMFSGMFQNQPFSNMNATVRTAYYTTHNPTRVSDTVIRPTREQLNNALENITYNASEHHSSTCPITLEEFAEGDAIRRIKHCGHVFSTQSINHWFNGHVKCPVCRYDIREYVRPITSDVSANVIDNPEEQQISDELIQGVTNEIASILENFTNNILANADSSANYIYQIDVPIITSYQEDISDDLDVE